MATLEQIKECKDEYWVRLALDMINFIKKKCNIKSSKRVFFFDTWCGREYFLCDDKIYVASIGIDKDNKKGLFLNSLYIATLENKTVVDFKTIMKDDTTPKFREFYGDKIDETRKLYTKEDFLDWYNSPVEISEFVDVKYSEAIEFLQNYKKTTFKTNKYLFYAKRDNDLTWAFFIYAENLKTGANFKIYTNAMLTMEFPDNPRKVFVEDLTKSKKVSKYQLRQCKKEFMEFCKGYCKELNTQNYWAINFVKQCIQPIEYDTGWSVRDVFSGEYEFDNIWVDDFLNYDKKPYFIISDKRRKISKIAAIDFLKPEYKSTDIYKAGTFKRNHWNLDKETIEKLTAFLNALYIEENGYIYKISKTKSKRTHIKTNWQYLIEIYNDNTGQFHGETLPLDLPMPDYMKLLENT